MKLYVVGKIGDNTFVGHMEKWDANHSFDSHDEITKTEYKNLRNAGIPSYGEHVTTCKKEGRTPIKRSGWTW